jgi:hypothetical protein
MSLTLEEKRDRVLVTLYQIYSTRGLNVDVEELEELADVGNEFYEILRYLGAPGKGWLKKSNMVVRITGNR